MMKPDGFEIAIDRDGTTTTVSCRGDLDLSTAPHLREAVYIAIGEDPKLIQLDGRGLTLLTCHGIEVLYEFVRSAAQRGIPVTLDLSRPARKVLDLVGLWWLGVVEDGLLVQDSLDRALASYAELAFDKEFPRSSALEAKGDYHFG